MDTQTNQSDQKPKPPDGGLNIHDVYSGHGLGLQIALCFTSVSINNIQQLQNGFNIKQKCKKHPSMTQSMWF